MLARFSGGTDMFLPSVTSTCRLTTAQPRRYSTWISSTIQVPRLHLQLQLSLVDWFVDHRMRVIFSTCITLLYDLSIYVVILWDGPE